MVTIAGTAIMNANGLRPRTQRVLDYVREYIRSVGYPPTLREIMSACEISSTSVARTDLILLQRAGYIRRLHDSARAITIVKADPEKRHAVARRAAVLMNWRVVHEHESCNFEFEECSCGTVELLANAIAQAMMEEHV